MSRCLGVLCCLASFALLGASATQPAGAFVPNSVWAGTEMGDPRRPHTPQARARPAKLVVTDRSGPAFAADYTVGAKAVHLEGKVDGHGQLLAKATRVIKGDDWGPHVLELIWSGTIHGDAIDLSYTQHNNLTQTVQLTLDENAEPGGKRRKNKSR